MNELRYRIGEWIGWTLVGAIVVGIMLVALSLWTIFIKWAAKVGCP